MRQSPLWTRSGGPLRRPEAASLATWPMRIDPIVGLSIWPGWCFVSIIRTLVPGQPVRLEVPPAPVEAPVAHACHVSGTKTRPTIRTKVDFTVVDYFVYAVALLLLASLALFVKTAIFDKRPQKTGLIMAVLAAPLFLIYYNDRWPFGAMNSAGDWVPYLRMRSLISPLKNFNGADVTFVSDVVPAAIIAG